MKKILVIALVCLLALSALTACGQDDSSSNSPPANNPPADNSPANNPPANNSPANNAPSDTSPAPPADNFDTSRVIALFTREDGSGTRDAFVSITGVGGDMYAEAVVISETNEILTKVEENDFAISYVSVGSLTDRVKALSIDGVIPSDETIMNGSYTLQRPLLVCVNDEMVQNELVQDFIAFMLSDEGQEISASRWTKVDVNAPAYTPSGLSGTLKVGGSTSVEPLMQRMSEAYREHNPGVNIEISGGGSGAGISESTDGIIDIGMSSRTLRDNEKEALTDYDIALDGVAVIVNPANPITGMSIEQVKDIFVGDSTRWSDVG